MRYTDRLPASRPFEVVEDERTIWRRVDISAGDRKTMWEYLLQGGFGGRVDGGIFKVKASPELPTFEVKLNTHLRDGPATLRLSHAGYGVERVQPRAASAEASYMLGLFMVQVDNEDNEVERWAPEAEDVGPQWSALMHPLAHVASIARKEHLIFTDGWDDLAGAGVKLADGGCRYRLRPSPQGRAWSIVDLPGTAYDWCGYGKFVMPTDKTLVAEVKIDHLSEDGNPQVSILRPICSRGGDADVNFLTLRRRISSSRCLSVGACPCMYSTLRKRGNVKDVGVKERKSAVGPVPERMVVYLHNVFLLMRSI